MLLKSSTFIKSLDMHLYRSNINLKIDIPYSLPLPYIVNQTFSIGQLLSRPYGRSLRRFVSLTHREDG